MRMQLAGQGQPRFIIVEDFATSTLMRAACAGTELRFFYSLRQLGPGHANSINPYLDRKKVAALVSAISALIHARQREHPQDLTLERLRRALCGLVDRDLQDSFLPSHLIPGQRVPPRSLADSALYDQIFTTPLNDIEVTALAEHLDLLIDHLGVATTLQESLQLQNGLALADTLIVRWLIPLFSIRAAFASFRPRVSAKGLSTLIGTNEIARIRARDSGDFAVHCARYSSRDQIWQTKSNFQLIIDETRQAVSDPYRRLELLHGHDFTQILATHLIIKETGSAPAADSFSDPKASNFRLSPGMRALAAAESRVITIASDWLRQRACSSKLGTHLERLIRQLRKPA